jgi:hypothetical protein
VSQSWRRFPSPEQAQGFGDGFILALEPAALMAAAFGMVVYKESRAERGFRAFLAVLIGTGAQPFPQHLQLGANVGQRKQMQSRWDLLDFFYC